MDNRQQAAQRAIKQHVMWATGAGMVPVPLVDFVAVSAIQVDLIKQLCTIHGIEYSEGKGKMWASALTGGTVARIGASLLKGIPVVGSILGGMSMAVASGATTYGLGQVVRKHLENGGTMSNLNVDDAKRQFDHEYEEGKRVAKDVQGNKGAQDVFEKLEKLGGLKEKGIITDAEFETKKAKLLEEM